MQRTWNKIFSDLGANIVFGSHSHIVQPVEYIGETLIFNGVGNFVNSYIEHHGDISFMAKAYINLETKDVIAGGIIPLLAIKDSNLGYYSIPVYKSYPNNYDQKKLADANSFVTKITLHQNIDIKDIEEEYYIFKDGYKKHLKNNLSLTNSDQESLIYQSINNYQNICFIGDSITAGTKNGHVAWYEPLMSLFTDKNVYNYSKGGYTSSDILTNFKDKLSTSSCELSIINIGTNDIRYNLNSTENYIANIKEIISLLPNSKIILLSPFRPTNKDKYFKTNTQNKLALYNLYDRELQKLANNSHIYYLNVNNYINKVIKEDGEELFLLDGIHPNNNYGVLLYSYATMRI